MKNFVALDFETANQYLTSVCSVGVVIVRDGQIVEKSHHLVRPQPDFFSRWASDSHGITTDDTSKAPLFPDVWKVIASKIDGLPIIAYNKNFDEECLKRCHELYKMQYPDYSFECTLSAARRKFPALPNHQLHTVSSHIGYKMRNSEHALADAEACAEIAMKVLQD